MGHVFRPRRLREKGLLRRMVRETVLAVDDLVYPIFVVHGRGVREPISSMPGQARVSIDELLKEAKDVAGMGIPAVLLFGVPEEKDPRGSEAYADDGIVQQAARALKDTGTVYMVGDWTNQDAEISRYLALYGRSGVPLYVYYGPHKAAPVVLPQILQTGDVVRLLRKGK